MDGLEALNILDNFGFGDTDDSDSDGERETRITRTRVNSGENLNEKDYKRTYQFTKDNVGRLVDMFRHNLDHVNNRGHPVSPLLQVELTLAHFAGNNYHRVSGQCHNMGRSAARDIIVRVTDAIIE